MDRRAQLLSVALELFAERGVAGASMRELARRAGVQPGLAYHYFESKRDLLRAVFMELGYLDPLRQPVERDVVGALRRLSPTEALAVVLEANLATLAEGGTWFTLIHAEVLHGDPDARAVGMEMWDAWGEQLRRLLVGAGLARPRQARAAAALLRSLVWGLFNEAQLTGDSPAGRHERSRQTARLLRALVEGHR